ncbi:MAG: amino acid permease [Thaumarchaeota archaeon]|nr:amino acid permease [Nitrososphaerota archaeon]
MGMKRGLSFFDVVNIIIGSIVGADIYIVSALTAGMVGPLAIFVWIIAGVFAMVLALVFAYSSYYVPRVGGPFAFVSKAFDNFYGFLTGWSMWIAEIIALPVFAIAFVQYLHYFIPLDFWQDVLVKAGFLFGLTFVNILGVKLAGKLNDILTIVKLSPLLVFIVAGVIFFALNPSIIQQNYIPLAPLGFENFGVAIVLIFWAYVGFEMGTLPASEIKNPKTTIPRAIITGLLIVIAFYLLTNFVLFGASNWSELAKTSIPLVFVSLITLGSIGAIMMGVGALVSVSGSNESGVLGISRLSYAMSIKGLFPKIFSKVHPKYKTPYAALIIQGVIAFSLSIYGGITELISFSVFNLAFAFLLVCISLLVLKKESETHLHAQHILPWIGIAICLYLLYSTSVFDKVVGGIIILLGIPLYVFFSPKVDVHHLKEMFLSEEAIFARRLERHEKFLAHFIKMCHRLYKKSKKNRS